jgi:hypothetical protein
MGQRAFEARSVDQHKTGLRLHTSSGLPSNPEPGHFGIQRSGEKKRQNGAVAAGARVMGIEAREPMTGSFPPWGEGMAHSADQEMSDDLLRRGAPMTGMLINTSSYGHGPGLRLRLAALTE